MPSKFVLDFFFFLSLSRRNETVLNFQPWFSVLDIRLNTI